MNDNLPVEALTEVLDRIILWIENCDSKASTVLACAGVVVTLLLSMDYIEKVISIYKYMVDNLSFFTVLYLVCNFLSILACMLGCIFLINVFMAKVDLSTYSKKGIVSDSLIFFGTIAQNDSFELYKSKLKQYSIHRLEDDILSQIYVCSITCNKKFSLYRKGLIISVLGFIFFLVTTIIGIIIIKVYS